MAIQSVLTALTPVKMGESHSSGQASSVNGFGRIVEDFLNKSIREQADADQAVLDIATGNADDFHNVALKSARSDINFRMILEVRNRLSEAFQEVMRMQI